jgi:endonuclease YncB( thermonuclease family)
MQRMIRRTFWRRGLLPCIGAVALLLAFAVRESLAAPRLRGLVSNVGDGDTITLRSEGESHRIRLLGIDAPERGQSYADAAKRHAKRLVLGRMVTVEWSRRDQYGRILGEVILPGGASMNQAMVDAGLAWHYKRGSKDRELARLESEARAAGRGLWRDARPEPPWAFRKRTRENRR